jgi:hypothetical protein
VKRFVQSSVFEYFIIAVIILNMIQMAIDYDDNSTTYAFALSIINYVFTTIFIFEMVLKLVAYGPKMYFKSHWNKFDSFVVISSMLEILMNIGFSSNLRVL